MAKCQQKNQGISNINQKFYSNLKINVMLMLWVVSGWVKLADAKITGLHSTVYRLLSRCKDLGGLVPVVRLGVPLRQRYWKRLFCFANFGRFRDVFGYPQCRVIILCRNVSKNENIMKFFHQI